VPNPRANPRHLEITLSDAKAISADLFAPIAPLNKGLGAFDRELHHNQIPRLNWNLLREDLSLPAAVLYQDKLQHNLEWMRRFIAAYGVKFAPHGKTSMAPRLFEMQLESGAWAITLATVPQVEVAYAHGVRRVLMANQLIGKQNMAAIARLLEDPAFEFFCLIDSAAQVDQLGRFFSDRKQCLRILIELGVNGGRAGIRNDAQLQSTLEALARWPQALSPDGIEIYEGVLHDEASIRAFLQRAVEVTRTLADENHFHRSPIMLTGAGSAWYDVVAEVFTSANFPRPVEIVLRPGCYLTHDVGAYREAQTRILEHNPIARKMRAGLIPALHIWAYVQSIPEADKAIVTMGRRDAAFDSGLPVPALHFRPADTAPQSAPAHWEVTKLMDQHAFLRIHPDDDLRVGDMLAFDICHPCLTFDKWRTLVVVDANWQVTEIIQTYF
jgi:D-serine dehydratase